MAVEISCIFGLPLPAASTPSRRTNEMTRAMTATSPTAITIVRSLPVSDRVGALSAASLRLFMRLLIHCAMRS